MGGWETLGAVPPKELATARLELHWAAQAAAAVGKLLLPPAADFSQQSFTWDDRARALVQGPVAAARPFRSALTFDPPALALLDTEGAELARLPLSGHTLEEADTWLERALEALLGQPLPAPLDRAAALAAHPLGDGGSFSHGGPAFAELARWFADGAALLGERAAAAPGGGAVRCWPHHFDLAAPIALDPPDSPATGPPENARTITLGLSPGDEARPAPYLYVTPWPPPADMAPQDLPLLPAGGAWNTAGWMGAVLEAEALVAAGPGPAQREAATAFLDAAIAACRLWLGA